MNSISFYVEKWSAFGPGYIEDVDISWIGPLLRRRMSHLDRMTATVLHDLGVDSQKIPLIFASEHGEIARSLPLRNAVASDQQMSPTQFSLSVHNAAIGLFSIAQNNTANTSAVAGPCCAIPTGFIEAILSANSTKQTVCLLIADEEIPAEFAPASPESIPHCVGVLIHTDSQKADIHSKNTLTLCAAQNNRTAAGPDAWLQLCKYLSGKSHSLELLSDGKLFSLSHPN